MEKKKRKPNGYWTEERVREEALKYDSIKEFRKCSITSHSISYKNKWMEEFFPIENREFKPKGHWNEEHISEEALKYETRISFSKGSASAYVAAQKLNILNNVCYHMKPQHNKWTYNKIKKEALKHETRSNFKNNNSKAYASALYKNILDKVCSHMEPQGHRYKRAIYIIKFPKIKKFYVGLTYNYKNRTRRHLNLSSNKYVKNLINNGEEHIFDYKNVFHDIKIIIKKEQEWIDKMEKLGWEKLNIAKAGSLGGNLIKWTENKIKEESLKYNSRSEFQKNCVSAHQAARRLNILDDVCSHMEPKLIYWTEEKIKKIALKYKNLKDFYTKDSNAYNATRSVGIVDKVCGHMTKLKRSNNYWTKERIQEEALKYISRSEFQKKSGSAHFASKRLGIYEVVCSHMTPKLIYWTEEKIKEEALKYETPSDFKENNSKAYNAALRFGILNDVCSHMINRQKPSGYWTEDKIKEEALKYSNRGKFSKYSGSAYVMARKLNILDNVCSHMKYIRKYWSDEEIEKESSKYENRSDFRKYSKKAYDITTKRKLLDKLFPK